MSTTQNAGSQSGNPLNNIRKRRIAKFSLDSLKSKNPLPGQFKDPDQVIEFYNKFRLIPYHAGNDYTMDGMIYFQNTLPLLSNTTGSCINSIATYGFSGKLTLERNDDSDFNTDDDYIDDETEKEFLKKVQIKSETKNKFTETLRNTIAPIKSFKRDTIDAYNYLKHSGNLLLIIRHTEFLGAKKTTYELKQMKEWRYVYNKDNTITTVLVADFFEVALFSKKDAYEQLPLYPNYKESGSNGLKTYSTAIHISVPTINPYYSFPSWFQCFLASYNEFQDSDYQIKQSATNFTGQTFIEVEDDELDITTLSNESAAKDGYESFADQLQYAFSADNDDPQTVLFTTRPHGAAEAFVFQFKPNLNENYFKIKGQTNEESIISAFQWSKRFLGKNESQGFSANVFIDELRVKEIGVLRTERELALLPINIVKREAFKFNQITDFDNYKIGIESNFDALGDFIIKGDREEGSKNNIKKHLTGKYNE